MLKVRYDLNYRNGLRGEDDLFDFEFQVEQVFAEGFKDGESLDFGEVQLILGDLKIAADFFLADNLWREHRHVGDLLPQLVTRVEKQAFQFSLLTA